MTRNAKLSQCPPDHLQAAVEAVELVKKTFERGDWAGRAKVVSIKPTRKQTLLFGDDLDLYNLHVTRT